MDKIHKPSFYDSIGAILYIPNMNYCFYFLLNFRKQSSMRKRVPHCLRFSINYRFHSHLIWN